jgi:tetratricopeptide (TPR) repeat protein
VTARELLGLTHYRLGNWREAIRQLESYRELTMYSTENHPVLADSYRALKRYEMVNELWNELREASPSAELVNEGRIVTAGALADQGKLSEGIALLVKGWKPPKKPAIHHLDRAYALANLYQEAGEIPRARSLFAWIVKEDADYSDALQRLRACS